MYTITIKTKLKTFEGKDTEKGETVGYAIANILATTPTKDKLRSWTLCQKFGKADAETVKIDVSEMNFVKDIIENSDTYFPYVIGQVMEILEGLKKDDEQSDTKTDTVPKSA